MNCTDCAEIITEKEEHTLCVECGQPLHTECVMYDVLADTYCEGCFAAAQMELGGSRCEFVKAERELARLLKNKYRKTVTPDPIPEESEEQELTPYDLELLAEEET